MVFNITSACATCESDAVEAVIIAVVTFLITVLLCFMAEDRQAVEAKLKAVETKLAELKAALMARVPVLAPAQPTEKVTPTLPHIFDFPC